MKRALLPVIALLAFAPSAQADPSCGLHALESCSTTSNLVSVPETQAAIRAFLGHEKGNLLYARPKVEAWKDAMEVLGGPPDEPKNLPEGLKLFSACRAHSCDEKGGMLLDSKGRILAIGIVAYHCGGPQPSGQNPCDKDAWLNIFMARNAPEKAVRSTLNDWAKQKLDAEPTPVGDEKVVVGHLQIKIVGR